MPFVSNEGPPVRSFPRMSYCEAPGRLSDGILDFEEERIPNDILGLLVSEAPGEYAPGPGGASTSFEEPAGTMNRFEVPNLKELDILRYFDVRSMHFIGSLESTDSGEADLGRTV